MEPLLSFLDPATQPLPDDLARERYHGALLGHAVGNALGGPLEGYPSQRIRALLPQGIRDIPAREKHQPWDDDVAQAIELAECLLETNPFNPDTYLRRLVRWAETSGRGIGRQTYEVLSRARAGTRGTEAAIAIWEESGRGAAGNGAIMRCVPVALRWRRDPLRLIEDAGHSARVTHYDPRCVWTTVAACAVIAHALAGSHGTLHELADGLSRVGAPDEVVAAVRRSATSDLSALELDEPHSMGYTVRTMSAGLWVFLNGTDFESTLLRIIHAGGDTDTNGAVAGAVLGARFGASSIPERWITALPSPQALRSLADRLWQAGETER